MSASDVGLQVGARSVTVRFANEGMSWVAAQVAELLPQRPRLFLIADSTVALLYEKAIKDALTGSGFEVHATTFEPGEEHKTLRTVSRLLDQMARQKLARDDVVIGLGGGVSTDVAGFTASIYARGISWIAVPTSLLGMVDAAIGGKTGVDHPLAKNLIGTFHQPLAVIAALKTLESLPEREWRSGSAEVVKAGLIAGGDVWQTIEKYGPNLHSWPREQAHQIISHAARVKAEIVSQDERERGLRRVLNLGHTFGHALEAATCYSVFSHGEAIFLGMRAAIGLSHAHGFLSASDSTRLDDILAQVPVPRADVSVETLLDALQHDKKVQAGALHWILLKKPGQVEIVAGLSQELVQNTAEWLCETVRSGTVLPKPEFIPRILVLNGPNLNLLGEREPELYGFTSYSELEDLLQRYGTDHNVDVRVRQSNHEGELISLIQQARHWADGIVINPGSYSHTSVGLRDALSAVTLPAIEVHLTDIATREEFRRTSLTAPACVAMISGKGTAGYIEALEQLTELIRRKFSQDRT